MPPSDLRVSRTLLEVTRLGLVNLRECVSNACHDHMRDDTEIAQTLNSTMCSPMGTCNVYLAILFSFAERKDDGVFAESCESSSISVSMGCMWVKTNAHSKP